jgi:hypothetical protein
MDHNRIKEYQKIYYRINRDKIINNVKENQKYKKKLKRQIVTKNISLEPLDFF